MSPRGSLRMSLVVTLTLILTLNSVKPVEPFLGDIFNTVCSSISVISNFSDCRSRLDTDLKEYTDEKGQITELSYCCAVSALRICVLDKIEKDCGTDSQEAAKKVVDAIVKTVKQIGPLPCEGDELYYRPASPACWPIWGHATIILIILMLLFCCICSTTFRRTQRVQRHAHPRRVYIAPL